LHLDFVVNLVDVRDAAEGLILAMERGRPGQRYVLGGESMPLRQVLEIMAEISGRRVRCIHVNGKVAEMVTATLEFIADHVTRRPPSGTAEGVRIALRAGPCRSKKRNASWAMRRARSNRVAETIAHLLDAATISLNGAQRRVRALDRFTSSAGSAVDPIATETVRNMLNDPGQWFAFALSGWTTTWPTQLLAIIWILWVISWVVASFWSGQTKKHVMTWDSLKYRSRFSQAPFFSCH
jgi:hypothetical protein